jgi:hypothetical protein
VLISVSGEAVRTLDVIDDPATVAQLAGQAGNQARGEFAACLKAKDREFEEVEAAVPTSRADVTDAAIRALALKREQAELSSRLTIPGRA